jgi:hypothetical protein
MVPLGEQGHREHIANPNKCSFQKKYVDASRIARQRRVMSNCESIRFFG